MARSREAEGDGPAGSLAFSAGVLSGRPLMPSEYAARRDAATQQALARYAYPRALPTSENVMHTCCGDTRWLPLCSLQNSPDFKSWQARRYGTHARQYAVYGAATAAAVLLALSVATGLRYRQVNGNMPANHWPFHDFTRRVVVQRLVVFYPTCSRLPTNWVKCRLRSYKELQSACRHSATHTGPVVSFTPRDRRAPRVAACSAACIPRAVKGGT